MEARDEERLPLVKKPAFQSAHDRKGALAATGIAISWMTVSTLIILVNKHILKDLRFGYPMCVSGMGLVVSGAASYLLVHHTRLQTAKTPMTRAIWLTKVLPVGIFSATTLSMGNMAYLYLGVGFIQMLKAMSPVFTMLALFLAGMETPTWSLVSSVLVIATGMSLATYGEMNISVVGLGVVVLAESSEAGRLVFTQAVLQNLRFGTFEGLMYMAPASLLWLFLAACFMEMPRMLTSGDLAIPAAHPLEFLGSACMGFLVTALGYATIKATNSLTYKVLGNLRNVILILSAVVLYDEVVSWIQVLGYGISIAGFAGYTYLKTRAMHSNTS